jgi:hypothetical protein
VASLKEPPVKRIAEKDSKETARMAIARGLAAVVRRDLHAFVVDAGMAAPAA